MTSFAGPGKALVLKKTKQLSSTQVNAPQRHRVSPLQLHRGQHGPFTPFCQNEEDRSPVAAHTNSPVSGSAASCTCTTLGCESTKPKAIFPLASGDKRPKYQQGGAMPAACTIGHSHPLGTGSVPKRPLSWQGTGYRASACRTLLPDSGPFPSSTTDSVLCSFPQAGWDGCPLSTSSYS